MEKNLKILANELRKPARKNFERRSVYALTPDYLWSADLVDLSNIKYKNQRITFLLNIIDVYSRYAYSIPLKNKSAESILHAFQNLERKPKKLWVDEGKEFYNKEFKAWCKQNDITIYSTHSGLKSVFVERFNRTLKEAFYKQFTEKLTTSYKTFLPEFINEYNNTIRQPTGETPYNLYFGKAGSQEKLLVKKESKNDFKIGDYVRLSKEKRTFEKGYTDRWTYEVFKIIEIDKSSNPYLYEVEDLDGEKIEGKVYAQEMQKTKIPFFKVIDKVIKREKNNVLVSYKGYPSKFNKLIPLKEYNDFIKVKQKLNDS